MGKRRLITDPSLPAADVALLASKILEYINEAVRLEHANAHEWHHPGSPAFFDGHRQFIGKLESWLISQGFPQFVPLPKWDPTTQIPNSFRTVKLLPAVTAAGFGPSIANPSPNLPMPANLKDLAQFPTAAALSADAQLQSWHVNVHVRVGGAMRDVTVSPCAAIFWPWHAFIDDIYEDWLAVRFPVGHVDLTTAFGVPPAQGNPTAYAFAAEGSQHVIYRSSNGHLRELWWTAAGQGSVNLTNSLGGPPAQGDPTAYIFAADGTQHVIYRSGDGHLHELWWTAHGGGHVDLTTASGGPPAQGNPTAYAFAAEGSQHVIYRSGDGHLHELWWK